MARGSNKPGKVNQLRDDIAEELNAFNDPFYTPQRLQDEGAPPLAEDADPEAKRPPEVAKIANEMRKRMLAVEPEVTKVMTGVAKATGAVMVGLPYRVKARKSLARKIHEDAINEGRTYEEVAKEIADGVRYTMSFTAKNYTKGVEDVLKGLEAAGVDFKTKNFWQPGDGYQGINIKITMPNGVMAELQIHTPKSFNVKEHETHKDYEIVREKKTYSTEQRKAAHERMVAAAAKIPLPVGYDRLMKIGRVVFQNFE